MLPRRGKHDPAQRREPCLVEREQAAAVRRAHLRYERVREERRVVREEVRGNRNRSVFERVLARKRVRVDRPHGRVREDELVERAVRVRGERRGRHAILDKGSQGIVNLLERVQSGVAREIVDEAQHETDRPDGLGDRDRGADEE